MFGHCLDPLNNILRLHSTTLALDIIIFALSVHAVYRLQGDDDKAWHALSY